MVKQRIFNILSIPQKTPWAEFYESLDSAPF